MKPFVVDVADLIHRPGARRTDLRTGPTTAMKVAETLIAEGSILTVEAKFEPVGSGVLATGWAEIDWSSQCRRCAILINGTAKVEFQEEFDSAAAVDDDTYPMRQDQVDLELVSREAILLGLPLAPLCREDCAGLCITCGTDLNEGACNCAPSTADPRWAALDALSFGQSSNKSSSTEEG
jgi:uncharacterized protein